MSTRKPTPFERKARERMKARLQVYAGDERDETEATTLDTDTVSIESRSSSSWTCQAYFRFDPTTHVHVGVLTAIDEVLAGRTPISYRDGDEVVVSFNIEDGSPSSRQAANDLIAILQSRLTNAWLDEVGFTCINLDELPPLHGQERNLGAASLRLVRPVEVE